MSDSLYQFSLQNQEPNSIEGVISLNPEHSIFEGHFVEKSILPGASMMVMVREILESCLGKSLVLKEAKQVKFLSIIDPNEVPAFSVTLSLSEKEEDLVVKTIFENEGKTLLKFFSSYVISE